jgi:hypothetical protein
MNHPSLLTRLRPIWFWYKQRIHMCASDTIFYYFICKSEVVGVSKNSVAPCTMDGQFCSKI